MVDIVLCVLMGGLVSFEPFQLIVDANLFGKQLDAAAAEAGVAEEKTPEAVKQEQEAVAQTLQLSAITIQPNGVIAAGITDKQASPPQAYWLEIGEARQGITLVDADYAEGIAVIRREKTVLALKLGVGLVDLPTPKAAPRAVISESKADPIESPTKLDLLKIRAKAPVKQAASGTSAKQRLLKRQAAIRQKQLIQQAKLRKEVAAKLAKQNAATIEQARRREEIERIKRGEAPTMQLVLTPEEDAELERAGVFNQAVKKEEEDVSVRESSR